MISNLTKLSGFFIGLSFPLLLIKPIPFGISLAIAFITIALGNKKLIFDSLATCIKSKNFPPLLFFFLIFSISTFFSISPERSILVQIYLFSFIFISYFFFLNFRENKELLDICVKFLLFGIIFCTTWIFFFCIKEMIASPQAFETTIVGYEVQKYKGHTNILTILVLLSPIFESYLDHKTRIISFILIALIIPCILISNCSAALLGIVLGTLGLIYVELINKLMNSKRKKILISFILFISSASIFLNLLPKKTSEINPSQINFIIPTSLLDAHRQIIWGYSFEKVKNKVLLGYGADTSNFIDGSQKVIGHQSTGTMHFIPSHPHNFFIELILEIGLLGSFSFFFLLLNTLYVFSRNNKIPRHLIFFNFYFWGASLVNFSFWAAWWQGSYFLILSLVFSMIYHRVNKF